MNLFVISTNLLKHLPIDKDCVGFELMWEPLDVLQAGGGIGAAMFGGGTGATGAGADICMLGWN